MEKAVLMVNHKEKLLRAERLRLIKEKIQQECGEKISLAEFENGKKNIILWLQMKTLF